MLVIVLIGAIIPVHAQEGVKYGPFVMVTSTVILKQEGLLPHIDTFQGSAVLVDSPDGIAYVMVPTLFADPQILLEEVLRCQKEGCEADAPLPDDERFQNGSMQIITKLHFAAGAQQFQIFVSDISVSQFEENPMAFESFGVTSNEEALCLAAADDAIALFVPLFLQHGGSAVAFTLSEDPIMDVSVLFSAPGAYGYLRAVVPSTDGTVAYTASDPYPYLMGAAVLSPVMQLVGVVVGAQEYDTRLELVSPVQISNLIGHATEDNFCSVYAANAAEVKLE